jgi:hypothetical protein
MGLLLLRAHACHVRTRPLQRQERVDYTALIPGTNSLPEAPRLILEMRRSSSEYLEEEGYGVSYQVQNLTVSKMPSWHFFRTEMHKNNTKPYI